MPAKKFCLTFAGAPGSGKTPIATYLSWQLNLPIFNHDAIRKEVMEDQAGWQADQINEYEKRRDARLQTIIQSGLSFIYDASMDRHWTDLKPRLEAADYGYFIISLDLSKELLEEFYKVKNYTQPLTPSLLEHKNFLKHHGHDIGLHLTDQDFPNRLALSLEWVRG